MINFLNPTYWAIVPAAGIGGRMQTTIPKQYLSLLNTTVLENSLSSLLSHPAIKEIILVVSANDTYWQNLDLHTNKKISVIHGGKERQHSVWNGLEFLKNKASPNDWVLVHDAVRPCLNKADLNKLMTELVEHPVGGLLATPVKDTLKKVDETGNVIATIDRTALWAALTPQMYRFEKLFKAMQNVIINNLAITDETAALELLSEKPSVVSGRQDNIKITYPNDLVLAEKILLSQCHLQGA